MALQAYPPVLLERKAAAIRKSMDEEKAPGVPVRISIEIADRQCVDHIYIISHAYISGSWGAMFSKGLLRPFRMFIYEPIVQLLGLYMAYVYGLLYSTHSGVSSILSSDTFQYSSRQYRRSSKMNTTSD